MPSRQARKQRQRIRQLEAALSDARQSSSTAIVPWSPVPPGSLQKSQGSMSTMPVPRTAREMIHPVYRSQVPVLEPYQMPETFGGFNRGRLFSGYGGGVSFEMLRLAVKRCVLQQAVHSCCVHDMLQLSTAARTPEQLGWRIQHHAAIDESVDTETPAIRAKCARVQRLFQVPHPVLEDSFRGFLSKVMQDYLTLNRVAVELIRNGRGEIVQFRAIDAATILPTFRVLQRMIGLSDYTDTRPQAYEVAARLLEEETGQPILDSEYVCVMRGQLVGTFAPGELLVWEDAPTTDVREIFAPSYAEKALEGIISWMYAFSYNRNYFSNGNPIEVILGISGEIEDDSFVALQEQLRENFSGLKGAWRVPLIQLPQEGQLQVLRIKENHRDMMFDEWMMTLTSLVCAIYRISTKRIEMKGRGQEGQGLFQHNQEAMIEASKEESFRVHSAFLRERFTMLTILIDPDLEFTWSGLEVEDREAEIKIETQEVTHYRSINEIRQRHGDSARPEPWADVPLNPLIFQAEGLIGGQAGGMPGQEDEQDAPQPAGLAPRGQRSAEEDTEEQALSKALGWETIAV